MRHDASRAGRGHAGLEPHGIPGAAQRRRLEAGQEVLIIGASGGVGSFAVQVAKAHGAIVTGLCSTSKVDLVRSLGADHVIDYTEHDFADLPGRYDLILDIGGGSPLRRLRRVLRPAGTIVFVGFESSGNVTGGLGRPIRAAMRSLFVRQRFAVLVASEDHADLERVAELMKRGAVTPSVDRAYPLERAAEAVGELEAGTVRGKLVLSVAEHPAAG